MTTTITAQQFKDAVLDVLNERGDDFVYEPPKYNSDDFPGDCAYSADGGKTGSCLFGAALIEKLGIPYSPSWEGANIVVLINSPGEEYPNRITILDADATLRGDAYSAQFTQDNGKPYGLVRNELRGWEHS